MSNLIKGVLFRKLNGIRGWSRMSSETILDVANIVKINGIRTRLFRIIDQDAPYELELKYWSPEEGFTFGPAYTLLNPGFGFAFYKKNKGAAYYHS